MGLRNWEILSLPVLGYEDMQREKRVGEEFKLKIIS